MSDTGRRGRPPTIPGSPASACIRIRVTPDIAADLERVAADNQTTRSGVIREAVNEFVLDYRDRLVFVSSCQ